jgi:hypothetical protein
MKQKTKKLLFQYLSFLLAVCTLMSIIPSSIFAMDNSLDLVAGEGTPRKF